MTKQEKQDVLTMRDAGYSYAKIAISLNLSENTVKSFCRRKRLDMPGIVDGDLCGQCGKPLIHTQGAKKKRYCSDRCRMAWWNAHPEAINHKSAVQMVCAACGISFESYGARARKYCSRKCYGQARRRSHA